MSNNPWYLVIDKDSNRYFIKVKQGQIFYIVREDSTVVKTKKTMDLIKEGYAIVGEAFECESKRLERLLEDTVF